MIGQSLRFDGCHEAERAAACDDELVASGEQLGVGNRLLPAVKVLLLHRHDPNRIVVEQQGDHSRIVARHEPFDVLLLTLAHLDVDCAVDESPKSERVAQILLGLELKELGAKLDADDEAARREILARIFVDNLAQTGRRSPVGVEQTAGDAEADEQHALKLPIAR